MTTYNLYQRNGRWYGDFRSLGGKQVALIPPGQGRGTKDRRVANALARRLADELLRRQLTGIVTGRTKTASLKDYALQHHQTKSELGRALSPSHLNDLAKRLEVAVDYFGPHTSLEVIDSEAVRGYYAHLVRRPNGRGGTLSTATQRAYLSALSGLMDQARCEGYIDRNPVEDLVVKPVVEQREAHYYEPGEVWRILRAAKQHDADRPGAFYHPILATFAHTGGRKSEVLGLDVDDVDFDAVVAQGVKGAIRFRPNRWRPRLKTRASDRIVPMWPDLRNTLKKHLRTCRGGLVFPSDQGSMRKDLRASLDRIGLAAGFSKGGVRTKPFRHTYGSMRIQTLDGGQPVALYTVARELGHRDTKMVEQTYGHLLTNRLRRPVVSYRPDLDSNLMHIQKVAD